MNAAVLLIAGIMVLGPATAVAEDYVSERGLGGLVTVDRLPEPANPVLAQGRAIWGGTCFRCHGGDKYSGAPKITSTRAWAPRIEQGMDVLVDHALHGFVGPKYTEMPARGGNKNLSDSDIKAAVAFMVWASGGDETALAYTETLN